DAAATPSAAACIAGGEYADLHVLVKHVEATRRVLEPAGLTVAEEREVVVVAAEDHPGVLADLARKVADAGVNLNLVYVATGTRIVFGSDDMPALRAALGLRDEEPAYAGITSPSEVDVEAGSLL